MKISGWLANVHRGIKTEAVAGVWEVCVYKINKHGTWINSSKSLLPNSCPPTISRVPSVCLELCEMLRTEMWLWPQGAYVLMEESHR